MRSAEKLTNAGALLRVNGINGTYSIFKENKPVVNPASRVNSTLYSLKRVIFIGELFKRNFVERHTIGFYSVAQGQAVVPFRLIDTSDVRHLKLKTNVDCDMLPVSVSFFDNISIGIYANALKTGVQYFVIEPRFGREFISELKQYFVRSRVIIYREDKAANDFKEDVFGIHEDDDEDEAIGLDIELIEKDEISLLSQNPLFSARVFLSKRQWHKLYQLPFKLSVSSEEVRLISFYLQAEMNEGHNETGILELTKLHKFYRSLEYFLSMRSDKVNNYLEENFMDTDLIAQIQKVIHLKIKRLDYSLEEDQRKRSFYDYVLLKLKERKLSIESSLSE